jgi:cytochrome P450
MVMTVIHPEDSPFAARSSSPTTLGTTLAALTEPVVFDELMAAPLVLRHKDVSAALRDSATFSTSFYAMPPMESAMIALNGSEHMRQRRIHNRFFNPVASARYADRIAVVADNAVAKLAGRTEAELVADLIARYPMAVFLDLLGIPDDLGDQGLAWVRAVVAMLGSPMNTELIKPGQQAYRELSAYVDTLVDVDDPGDNMLGDVIRAHIEEGGFSVAACSTAAVSLLLGGFETTIQMMSGTLASLLFNPTVLAEVRADHARIDAAIEEAFRWANPSAGLYRLVTEDTSIAGTDLTAGSMVYLCIASAHYDASVYPEPSSFDLSRRAAHLGFGLGPHYCAGAPLARIEVRAAVSALLDAFPSLRLDPSRPPAFHYGARGFVQHGTEALSVLL